LESGCNTTDHPVLTIIVFLYGVKCKINKHFIQIHQVFVSMLICISATVGVQQYTVEELWVVFFPLFVALALLLPTIDKAMN